MKKFGAALALTTGLLAGCSELAAPTTSLPTSHVTAQQYQEGRQASEHSFDSVKSYWLSKGIPVGRVALRILEGTDAVRCTPGNVARAIDTTPQYCTLSTTVVVPENYILSAYDEQAHSHQPDRLLARQAIEVAVAHEYGHAVQDVTGKVKSPLEAQTGEPYVELQDDCYAGEVIAGLDDETAKALKNGGQPPFKGDAQHGTVEQREAYLGFGLEGDDCSAIY